MKRHFINAACGVVDYAAYPVVMLFVGPFTLRRLGAAEFGLWMIAAAVISSGGIIASGFSDANLQRVSQLLQKKDIQAVRQTVRSMMAINLITGALVAFALLVAIPWLASRIEAGLPSSIRECMICLWIAAGCVVLRSIHAVAVSTQRGFQDFRASVRITSLTHLATLGMAALLTVRGHGPIAILAATAAILVVATFAQCREVTRLLGAQAILPRLDHEAMSALLSKGVYVWFQTVGGVLADRIDRLLLGATLGAVAVAPYVLCVQLAQPLLGLTGSSLSFLMPYLSGMAGSDQSTNLRRNILSAIGANLLIVFIGVVLTLYLGTRLLPRWVGSTAAPIALQLFPRIVIGSALLAVSVTGIYTLQALGRFRILAGMSLGSRLLLFPVMLGLLHRSGMSGLATFRLYAGAVALAVYVPVLRVIWPRRSMATVRVSAESHSEGAFL
ncbi:lipopolysaccharide biosynthesis protein [Granulicella sibirica]|uniref:Polysaccharide biosynthesis protein n=1 Tax=Granulicella sibirica TaxID=2479048 RepID=A0A4Q0SYS7_9BACT|nr:oligosaccharide flippase family protein [Granulicella sibirica]RXH54196.1 hypothetical protein GRAN_4847 [Granulicella sibirica]